MKHPAPPVGAGSGEAVALASADAFAAYGRDSRQAAHGGRLVDEARRIRIDRSSFRDVEDGSVRELAGSMIMRSLCR